MFSLNMVMYFNMLFQVFENKKYTFRVYQHFAKFRICIENGQYFLFAVFLNKTIFNLFLFKYLMLEVSF